MAPLKLRLRTERERMKFGKNLQIHANITDIIEIGWYPAYCRPVKVHVHIPGTFWYPVSWLIDKNLVGSILFSLVKTIVPEATCYDSRQTSRDISATRIKKQQVLMLLVSAYSQQVYLFFQTTTTCHYSSFWFIFCCHRTCLTPELLYLFVLFYLHGVHPMLQCL